MFFAACLIHDPSFKRLSQMCFETRGRLHIAPYYEWNLDTPSNKSLPAFAQAVQVTFKALVTFHYASWSTGILIFAYYNPRVALLFPCIKAPTRVLITADGSFGAG